MRGAYKILVRRPEVKRNVERFRHGWEDNIEIDLGEILVQNRI
jgi:hypothetical protein